MATPVLPGTTSLSNMSLMNQLARQIWKALEYPIFNLKPPNLHTYSHQLLGFTIVSRQDAIMRFNVVLFVIISCGFELAVFIHGQHYYYPVAPPSLHCLTKHCDQIVTGRHLPYAKILRIIHQREYLDAIYVNKLQHPHHPTPSPAITFSTGWSRVLKKSSRI